MELGRRRTTEESWETLPSAADGTGEGECGLLENVATRRTSHTLVNGPTPTHTQVTLIELSEVQKTKKRGRGTELEGEPVQGPMWKTGEEIGGKYGYCIYVCYS